jgi:hypothetical protein
MLMIKEEELVIKCERELDIETISIKHNVKMISISIITWYCMPGY